MEEWFLVWLKSFMVIINVIADSKFRVKKEVVVERLAKLLAKYKLLDRVQVDVEIVGKRRIKELNEEYLRHEGITDVLSFPLNDPADDRPFVSSPDGILRLGDIVVCYPIAMDEALSRQVSVDVQVADLAEHGCMHLLGFHHE